MSSKRSCVAPSCVRYRPQIIDQLTFERATETFGPGIVPTVPHRGILPVIPHMVSLTWPRSETGLSQNRLLLTLVP